MNKDLYTKYVKWGVIGLFCAIAAPIAWAAVTGIIGMLAAAGIGFVGFQVAPVVSDALTKWKYRALDAAEVSHIEKVSDAAAANPIETLMSQSFERRASSDQFRTAITMFRTEVKNFKDQITAFGREYPEDVARFEMQVDAMEKLLKFREDRYKQLQIELDKFDAAIKRAKAMWVMSQAAQKMNKAAGVEMGDPFEKIKADSAINSVMTSMNKAFSEMETALLDNKEVQQAQQATVMIENSPPQILAIDVTTKKVKV